jgi:hypothetical protein
LQFLSDQDRIAATREATRVQAAQLAKDPDAIRGANALIEAAKREGGKVPTLQEALIAYGQSSAGYQGRELTEERSRLEKADKQFNEDYGMKKRMAELEKDPAKKKKLLDELDTAKKEIYKRYKVKDEDGVSSNQGGATQSGNTRVRLDAQGNIIK